MTDYHTKLAALPAAAFYDARDNERLSHEDPVAAVIDAVEAQEPPGPLRAADVHALAPITVKAYARTTVGPRWFRRATASVVACLTGMLDEDYGPDEQEHSHGPDVAAQSAEIEAALRGVVGKVTVYRCDVVGEVSLDGDELLALLRDAAPDYLADEGAGDA